MSARYDFVGCNEDLLGATGGLPVVDEMGVMAREELEEEEEEEEEEAPSVTNVFSCFADLLLAVCRMGERVIEGIAIEREMAGLPR
jgi:hypothetical protein